MSINIHDNDKNQWVPVEGSDFRASDIPLDDLSELYDSDNVEGALRETGLRNKQIDRNANSLSIVEYKLNDHIKNHPSGTGGNMPTIESNFKFDIVDAADDITIPIYFKSPNLGEGTCYIVVNGMQIATQEIEQGDNNIKIGVLGNGDFTIELKVKDRYGLFSNKLIWTVTCGGIELKLLSDFSSYLPVDSNVIFRYQITTTVKDEIKLYIDLDGTKTEYTVESGIGQIDLGVLSLGTHKITYHAEVGPYTTDVVSNNIVITSSNTLYLASNSASEVTFVEGEPAVIDYCVAKISESNFYIEFTLDGNITTGTCKSGTYKWSNNTLTLGKHTLTIFVKDSDNNTASLSFTINIIEDTTYTKINPPMDSLIAWWDARDNKSNTYEDRNIWVDKISGITANLYNFNYSSNGWMNDLETGEYWLECNGNCRVEIPYAPFKNNFETIVNADKNNKDILNGGTIHILFKTQDIGNREARVLDITDTATNNTLGCYINTYEAYLKSESHTSRVDISEDQYISITYVIDRSNSFGKVYVDGILTDAFVLTKNVIGNKIDYESFAHDAYIYLNSTKDTGYGMTSIKQLMIYDKALTHDEVVTLCISEIEDKKKQRERWNFNFDNKTMPKIYLAFNKSNLDATNQIPLDMRYESPNSDLFGASFTSNRCFIHAQGTSSLQYVVPNFNTYLYDQQGNAMYINPYLGYNGTAKPEMLFCLKTNYMESSNSHITGLAECANDLLYYDMYNPAQIADMAQNKLDKPQVRHTISGFPVYVYVKDTDPNAENKDYVPYGIYDMNTDRYSPFTFGYEGLGLDVLSYEVAANTETGAGAFHACPNPEVPGARKTYYSQEFKRIYPKVKANDDWNEIGNLVEFVAAAGEEDFVTYLPQHFDVKSLLRYYLFVNMFGLVDSLGKNMKLTSFDGGNIWYPQLYDTDTAIGLNNQGLIKFDVDIEPDTAGTDGQAAAFNTSTSLLWVKLVSFMNDDLKSEWYELRTHGFTLENIMHYLYDENIAKIPEKFYNDSMQQKYLNFQNNFLAVMHGSRYHQIKRWVRERMLYMDSIMGYEPSFMQNICIRSEAMTTVALEIEPYSPLQIRVKWTNATSEDDYKYAVKKVKRGEIAYLQTQITANDQEVFVYGAQYIKRIHKLSTLKPKNLDLSSATGLVDLECHSVNLDQLSINGCKLLQTIDISGCTNLGKLASSTQVLDVSDCANLRYINAYNTALTGIDTNSLGGNLEEIYYPYTVQTVALANQNNLHTVGLPTELVYGDKLKHSLNKLPNALTRVSINNCPNIKTFNKDYSDGTSYFKEYKFISMSNTSYLDIDNSLENFNYIDLSYFNKLQTFGLHNMKTINLLKINNLIEADTKGKLEIVYISNCNTLEEIQLNSDNNTNDLFVPAFADNAELDLGECFALKRLISNYPVKGLAKIILPVGIQEDNSRASNLTNIEFMDAYNTGKYSDIKNIINRFSTRDTTAEQCLDLENIKLNKLELQTVILPVNIYNLYLNVSNKADVNINKYRNSLLTELLKVQGTFDFSNYIDTDLDDIFKNDDLTDVIIVSKNTLPAVTSAVSAFENAYIIHMDELNVFLNQLVALQDCTAMFKDCTNLTVAPLVNFDSVKIAKNMFRNCNKITTVANFDLSNLENADYMFYNCLSLKNLNRLNIASLLTANNMFGFCRALQSIEFDSATTLTNASNMFYNDDELRTITLFDTSYVKNFGYMFYNCKKLAAIPNLILNSAISLDYTFYKCLSMAGIIDGSKYWAATNPVANHTLCFANCSATSNYDEVPTDWGGGLTGIGENDLEISIKENTITTAFADSLFPSLYENYPHNMIPYSIGAWEAEDSYMTTIDPIVVDSGAIYLFTQTSNINVYFYQSDANGNIGDLITYTSSLNFKLTIPTTCNYIKVAIIGDASDVRSSKMQLNRKDAEIIRASDFKYTITTTDGKVHTSGAETIQLKNVDRVYVKYNSSVNYILFDSSYLKSHMISVNSIDLSNCTSCYNMFNECASLENVAEMNIEKVRNIDSIFANCSNLKTIQEFNLTTIESMSYAFYNCQSLMQLPAMNLSTVKHMDHAFYNCRSLEAIDLSNFQNVLDMTSTFEKCINIGKFDNVNATKCKSFERTFSECTRLNIIKGLDTTSATTLMRTFNKCNSLASLPASLATKNNTSLDYTFYECKMLVAIPAMETSNVVTFSYAFYRCSKLTQVPVFNYSKASRLSNTFGYCTLLKKVTMGDTYNINSLSNTFNNCTALEEVEGLDTTNCSQFIYAFYNCKSLKQISICVKTATNLSYAFSGCQSITKIEFVKSNDVSDETIYTTDKVTNFSNAFYNCNKLTELSTLSIDNATNLTGMFDGCILLANIDIKKWTLNAKVTALTNTFSRCSSLNAATINHILHLNTDNIESFYCTFRNWSVESIDFSNMKFNSATNIAYMLYDCPNLKTVTGLSKSDTVNLTDMSYMLYNCTKLTDIDLNIKTTNLINCSYLFYRCLRLTNVNINTWDTTSLKNCSYMFYNCLGLTTVDLSNWEIGNLLYCQSMFSNCNALTDICTTSWNIAGANIEDMSQMYYGCVGLTAIDSIYIKATKCFSFFEGCNNIKTVNNITIEASSEAYNIFYNCLALTSVGSIIAKNVNDLTNTFYSCTKLKTINNMQITRDDTGSTNMTSFLSYCSAFNNLTTSVINHVSNLSNAFNYCTNLEQLDCTSWNLKGCTNMESTFSYCNSLQKLITSANFNTLDVKNFNYTFSYCSALQTIANLNFASAVNMTYTFYRCASLLYLNDMVTEETYNSTTDYTNNPEYNTYVDSIGVTHLYKYAAHTLQTGNVQNFTSAFEGCMRLLFIPNIVTTNAINVSRMYYCNTANVMKGIAQPAIYFDNSHIKTYSKCFYNCKKLANYSQEYNGITYIPNVWKGTTMSTMRAPEPPVLETLTFNTSSISSNKTNEIQNLKTELAKVMQYMDAINKRINALNS